MVSNAWEIFYTATSNHDDGVFLEVMADAGNISRNLNLVRKTNAGDFSQSRVRLFWSGRFNHGTNSASLGTTGQSRRRGFVADRLSRFSNQLIYGRHFTNTIPAKNFWLRLTAKTHLKMGVKMNLTTGKATCQRTILNFSLSKPFSVRAFQIFAVPNLLDKSNCRRPSKWLIRSIFATFLSEFRVRRNAK